MSKVLHIILAGGGTGGHLFPALALGAEILRQRPDSKIHYIGSKFGVEQEILPHKQIPFTLLPVRGLQRNLNWQEIGRNLLLPGRVLNSLFKIKRLFNSFTPDVVVGTGGYASALPLYVGVKRGISTLIQEQNSFPGITTRWFAEKVDRICIGFEEAANYFQKKNYYLTGNPMRSDINSGQKKAGLERFHLHEEQKTVFLFGGSQGSLFLNQTMEKIVPNLLEANIQILWQTGVKTFANYQIHDSDTCRVVPFVEEMNLAYACSDLVISRAGALTIAEITVCGKPAILVPFPGAAGNHQEKNGLVLEAAGAAEMLPEKNLQASQLSDRLQSILSDDKKLKSMSRASAKLAKPRATADIVQHIFELAEA